jgi:hypothetical protein
MSATPQTVQEDLAFLRSLVRTGDGFQASFGAAYLVAGLCYGGQMALSAAQAGGSLPATSGWSMTIGLGPSVLFLVTLAWIIWRGRGAAPTGVVGRAIGQVFGCVGLANLALVAVVGSVALRQHSWTTWLIYPCTVFVLQGAAWLIALALRRRPWLGLVAAGWFAAAIAMACSIPSMPWFFLWTGAGFLLCMVVPGAVVLRLARQAA